MKNPMPLPAVITAGVVAVVIVILLGIHFMSDPVVNKDLPDHPVGKFSKLPKAPTNP